MVDLVAIVVALAVVCFGVVLISIGIFQRRAWARHQSQRLSGVGGEIHAAVCEAPNEIAMRRSRDNVYTWESGSCVTEEQLEQAAAESLQRRPRLSGLAKVADSMRAR